MIVPDLLPCRALPIRLVFAEREDLELRIALKSFNERSDAIIAKIDIAQIEVVHSVVLCESISEAAGHLDMTATTKN